MDLRSEMSGILRDFGHDVLLVRVDKRAICTCVDAVTLSAKKECPVCLGTGFLHTAERVRVRTVVSVNTGDILPRLLSQTSIGPAGIGGRVFYLQHTIRPKKQDLVIMCDWAGEIPIFDEYTEVLSVNNAEPLRGDGGRIEYFAISCQTDPVKSDIRLDSIKRNAGSTLYRMTLR